MKAKLRTLEFLWSLALGFWDFFHRQFNREAAPLPDRAADRYRSAMRFDDMFDNSQTDADPPGFAAQFGAAAIKRLKNLLVFFRWNAVAVIFDKSSTRTRVSFHVGISDLGGSPLIISTANSQLGGKETPTDTARVLERMVSGRVKTNAMDALLPWNWRPVPADVGAGYAAAA